MLNESHMCPKNYFDSFFSCGTHCHRIKCIIWLWKGLNAIVKHIFTSGYFNKWNFDVSPDIWGQEAFKAAFGGCFVCIIKKNSHFVLHLHICCKLPLEMQNRIRGVLIGSRKAVCSQLGDSSPWVFTIVYSFPVLDIL